MLKYIVSVCIRERMTGYITSPGTTYTGIKNEFRQFVDVNEGSESNYYSWMTSDIFRRFCQFISALPISTRNKVRKTSVCDIKIFSSARILQPLFENQVSLPWPPKSERWRYSQFVRYLLEYVCLLTLRYMSIIRPIWSDFKLCTLKPWKTVIFVMYSYNVFKLILT